MIVEMGVGLEERIQVLEGVESIGDESKKLGGQCKGHFVLNRGEFVPRLKYQLAPAFARAPAAHRFFEI